MQPWCRHGCCWLLIATMAVQQSTCWLLLVAVAVQRSTALKAPPTSESAPGIGGSENIGQSSFKVTVGGSLVINNALIDDRGFVHVWMPIQELERLRVSSSPVALQEFIGAGWRSSPAKFLVVDRRVLVRTCVEPLKQGLFGVKLPVPGCFTQIEVHADEALPTNWVTTLHHNITTFFVQGRDANFAEWNNEVMLPAYDSLQDYRSSVEHAAHESVQFAVEPYKENSPLGLLTGGQAVMRAQQLKGTTFTRLVLGMSDRLNQYYMWEHRQSNSSRYAAASIGISNFRDAAASVLGLVKQNDAGRVVAPPLEFSAGVTSITDRPVDFRPRVLWMRRSQKRRVLNPEVVDAAWDRTGAKVSHIFAGDVPLVDFMRALWSHDIVFGVHGADFANTVYMPSPTRGRCLVIQLVNCGYDLKQPINVEPHYYGAFALAEGHLYMQLSLGELQSCAGLDHYSDFEVKNTTGLHRFLRAGAAFERGHAHTPPGELVWDEGASLMQLQKRFCGDDPLCAKIGLWY